MRTLVMVMVVVLGGCGAEPVNTADAGGMVSDAGAQPPPGSIVPAFDAFTPWALNGTGSGGPAVVQLASRAGLPAGVRQVQLVAELCYGGSGITQPLVPVTVAFGGPVDRLDDTSRRAQASVECSGSGTSTVFTSHELWVDITAAQELAVWGVPPPNASRGYPFLYRVKLLAWRTQ